MKGKEIRAGFLQNCNRKRLYLASTFTFPYMATGDADLLKRRIEQNKELFRNRKLVIFSGKTVFDKIRHNVFEYAESRQHIFCKSRNAWSQYKEILETARKFPKDTTLCFILGPTATVAAWDLAHEGYTAFDIGHIAKDYNAYMEKMEKNSKTNAEFFAPD